MHPSPEASSSTPAPPNPDQALAAHLDDVMAQAEIAANAERDLGEEAGTPSAQVEAPEASEDDAEDEDEAEDDEQSEPASEEALDESAESADEEGDDEAEAPTPPPRTAPTSERPRLSRRGADREIERLSTELNQTRQQLQAYGGEVATVRSGDQRILNHLYQQSGYVREQNGRLRYENLSEKVLRGTASVDEADEVAQMTSWQEFARPIYRAAEEHLMSGLAADWSKLRDLDGVGDDGLKRLNAHTSVVAAVRDVHSLAYAAGAAKERKTLEAKIARLQAENKGLKTGNLARSPQPATANGAAVSTRAGFLARAIDPSTGTTTDDMDREVAAGKWLGADLAKH
jgi:hypothetical protein